MTSTPSLSAARRAAPAHPFTLSYRGSDYWRVDAPEALAAYLDARPDMHRWETAAHDRKAHKEICRWYHKPKGARYRVEPSGIVLDRDTTGQVWLRLVGTDLSRARRIVEELAGGQVREEVQACLF